MPSTREAAITLCLGLTPKLEGGPFYTAIPDPLKGWAVPTIGYGHTGPEVHQGTVITPETATYLLHSDLETAADDVEKCVPAAQLDAILDNHERAALYDFSFNLGANPSWTIWALLRKGDVAGAKAQIPRFDHGEVDGVEQVVPGLEHRREAEIIFWNTADIAAAVAVTQTANAVPAPSSAYTRSIPTPPAPQPAPAGNTASLVTKLTGAAAAIGVGAQQAHDIIAPHASEASVFASAAAVCTGVVIVAGILGLIIHAEQSQARKT